MSTFAVTIERLTIHPHPNADRLELAQVGLYRAVVEKGRFQTGDHALYIPEQAVLPPGLEDPEYGTRPGRHWVHAADFHNACDLYDIPAVPVVYDGPFSLDALRDAAAGPTVLGRGAHIREGVVIRPFIEARSDVLGGRKIAKYVSPDYLLRGGDTTEFE